MSDSNLPTAEKIELTPEEMAFITQAECRTTDDRETPSPNEPNDKAAVSLSKGAVGAAVVGTTALMIMRYSLLKHIDVMYYIALNRGRCGRGCVWWLGGYCPSRWSGLCHVSVVCLNLNLSLSTHDVYRTKSPKVKESGEKVYKGLSKAGKATKKGFKSVKSKFSNRR